jgi:hypothetical protein
MKIIQTLLIYIFTAVVMVVIIITVVSIINILLFFAVVLIVVSYIYFCVLRARMEASGTARMQDYLSLCCARMLRLAQ